MRVAQKYFTDWALYETVKHGMQVFIVVINKNEFTFLSEQAARSFLDRHLRNR